MTKKVLQADGSYCYTENCRVHTPAQHALLNTKDLNKMLDKVDTERSPELRKYPRTAHLHDSPGATSDDKWASPEAIAHMSSGIDLIVTEKMDGGNLTFTRNHFFGRSLDSGTHAWDTHAKALWAKIRFEIPEGWRVSGESMYARRSVPYENLPGVYIVFGIWDETNTLLSWKDTQVWAELLELPTVPVVYEGNSFNEATKIWGKTHNTDTSEGFVVRNANKIAYDEFRNNVLKWVRADHVRTAADWRHRDDFAVNTFVKE